MAQQIKTDLIPLLKNLTAALQPYAAYHSVELNFETKLETFPITHHPELIISDLSKLLCRAILYTPQEYCVKFEVSAVENSGQKSLLLRVQNTIGNIGDMYKLIILDIQQEIKVYPNEGGGTVFEWHIAVPNEEGIEEKTTEKTDDIQRYRTTPFYKKLHEHLSSHFTSLENMEKAAAAKGQREGVFLQKVNAILLANLDQEGFNTEALGKALALSRTQLYRRLNSIIGFSPSKYIWYVRLQKAKEMLETENVSVGEVAFQTGFQNLSHFTRAFRKQFGFNPSQIKNQAT